MGTEWAPLVGSRAIDRRSQDSPEHRLWAEFANRPNVYFGSCADLHDPSAQRLECSGEPTLSGEPPLSCGTFSRNHRIEYARHVTLREGGRHRRTPPPSFLGFAAWLRANENSLAGSLPIFALNVSNPPVNRPSGAATPWPGSLPCADTACQPTSPFGGRARGREQ